MALFTPGPAVAAVSGSVGGTVFSHNKGGMYMRNRSIPTNPSTLAQQNTRARLATMSTAWQTLTDDQRQAWEEYGRQNPTPNALGNPTIKSGSNWHIALNSRILQASGTIITVPPVVAAPDAFTLVTQDGDIGAGDVDLTFAAALTAGNQIELFAAVTNSQGITYIKNQLRFITFSVVDQASPWANQSTLENTLGTLIVGQKLHIEAAQYDPANGLRSPFIRDDVIITTT